MDENKKVTEPNLDEMANLAGRDQRLAEARNSAAMYARFWNELPDDMPDELKASLILGWQHQHSQWLAEAYEDDEYE